MIKNGICKVLSFFFALLLICAFFKMPVSASELGDITNQEEITETEDGETEDGEDEDGEDEDGEDEDGEDEDGEDEDGEEEEAIIHTLTLYDNDGTTALCEPCEIEVTEESDPVYLSDVYSSENAELYGMSQKDLNRILNGYEVWKWEVHTRKSAEEEFAYKKTMGWYEITTNSNSKYDLSKYDIKLVAVYASDPAEFPVKYVLNKGKFAKEVPSFLTVKTSITLSKPTRKGYLFDGWYLDKKFTADKKVTKLTKKNCIDLDYAKDNTIPTISVYAKWKDAKPAVPTIKKLSNSSSGKVTVTLKKPSSAPLGYEIQFSTDKNFKKDVRSAEFTSGVKYTVDSLTKGKTYYFRVRAYNKDSLKEKAYCAYSKVKSVKITKGETEVAATASSATLKTVNVTGKKTKYLSVTASVSQRVASKDDYYYLVTVDPLTGAYDSFVANVPKNKDISIKVPLIDEKKGTNLYAGKFAIAVKSGDKSYTIISSSSFINNPQDAAAYTKAFPNPKSKKGRQGIYDSSDGDKHYFMNFNVNNIISTKAAGGTPYKYNGKTYYFNLSNIGYDPIVSAVNKDGGTVTFQLMLRYDSSKVNLIKATARGDLSKPYYAFNVEEAATRKQLEAAFYALTEHYSQPDRHVDNWILGNEVNTFSNPIGYYWSGYISREAFMNNYAQTFRILYYAATSNNKNARVYTCVDHTFNDRDYDWGVKNFTASFNYAVKALNPNIKWNLAYHAYSAVLTNADFWNDNSAEIYTTSNDYSTDFVSPLNIEVLTQYITSNFGNVRIILSEQAFSSSAGNNPPVNGGRAAGEDVQAAAIAYLYYKAMFNPYIDSVIYSHPSDNFGPGMDFQMKTKAYNVYKYMDTPSYAAYTSSCLETITGSSGSSWYALVPGFNDSTLKAMPGR